MRLGNSILRGYALMAFLKAAAIVMLILLALFSFLALGEALEDVGEGEYTITHAIAVVVMTTPSRVVELLPVTVLLASVLGLGVLANTRELVAYRAAGISPRVLAVSLSVIALLIALAAFVLQTLVIPPAERKAQEYRSRTLSALELGGEEFWTRRDGTVLRVGQMEFGRIPQSIEIYELDDNYQLNRIITAESAEITNASHWQLQSVKLKTLSDGDVGYESKPEMAWHTILPDDQFAAVVTPAYALSMFDLLSFVSENRRSGVDTSRHESLLWQQLVLPLNLVAMALLGLPLVLSSLQSRSAGYRGLIGGLVGISFYLFQEITANLAVLLELSPVATAVLPAMIIFAVALAAIRRFS